MILVCKASCKDDNIYLFYLSIYLFIFSLFIIHLFVYLFILLLIFIHLLDMRYASGLFAWFFSLENFLCFWYLWSKYIYKHLFSITVILIFILKFINASKVICSIPQWVDTTTDFNKCTVIFLGICSSNLRGIYLQGELWRVANTELF